MFAELTPAVRSLLATLAERGYDALLVGGCVRDALLGRRSKDFDVVTNAPLDEVRGAARTAAGVRGVYDLGERFGTLGVALEDGGVLESSAYRPDALALATRSERFAADAAHRDFTVNAIAYDAGSGEVLDPLGGRADLEAGVLRAPGDAAERFAEDPLRVLRAARFVSQLGFALDPGTGAALAASASALADVAVERVREELTKLLVGDAAAEGLTLLAECGALRVVLPEIADLDGVTQPTFHDLDVLGHTLQTVVAVPATPVLRWAALLHDAGKAPARTVEADGRIRFFRHAEIGAGIAEKVCRRLRMSSDDTAAIVHLVAEHMRLGDVNLDNPRSVDRAVRKLDLRAGAGDGTRVLVTAEDALELTLADFSATAHRSEEPRVRAVLTAALAESRERGTHQQTRSPVSGEEMMRELGLDEGPAIGAALDAVIEAVEQGEIDADDREGALEVARRAVGTRGCRVEQGGRGNKGERGASVPRPPSLGRRPMPRFENDDASSHPLVTELGSGTYYWCQCGKTKTVPYCDGSHTGSGIEPLAFKIEEPITSAICNCGLTTSPPYCSGAHVEIE